MEPDKSANALKSGIVKELSPLQVQEPKLLSPNSKPTASYPISMLQAKLQSAFASTASIVAAALLFSTTRAAVFASKHTPRVVLWCNDRLFPFGRRVATPARSQEKITDTTARLLLENIDRLGMP